MRDRVALVSCVKSKRSAASPACDLYTSPLFRGLRSYAESHADRWFILSAMSGLVDPHEIKEPYERTLNTMRTGERDAWASTVQSKLAGLLSPSSEVLLLAGARYREGIEPYLTSSGIPFTVPLQGLRLGLQLAWLRQRNGPPGIEGTANGQ